jgi:stage II sporulation protein D
MSQWGAQGMALGGKSAEEILKHYYLGIEITTLGGA